MAADTSSAAAGITPVIGAKAAALASRSVEPILATSVAAAVSRSGVATRYDITALLRESSKYRHANRSVVGVTNGVITQRFSSYFRPAHPRSGPQAGLGVRGSDCRVCRQRVATGWRDLLATHFLRRGDEASATAHLCACKASQCWLMSRGYE